jgi:hypothetical protein
MKSGPSVLNLIGAALLAGSGIVLFGCGGGAGFESARPTYQPPGYAYPANIRGAERHGITREDYHGWTNALVMRTEHAEVIVVPEIGRVMSFSLAGGENVFWDDPSLYGKPVNPEAAEWINFGGDKSWPAPEAEWGRYTGRKEWRPPPAFDAAPNDVRVDGRELIMTSPVDPFYRIQITRRINLSRKEPKLAITTTYERVAGEPSKVGVWVITQLKDPVAVFMPRRENSAFAKGFYQFSEEPWTNVVADRDFIHVTRDAAKPHKLGSDADQILWVGAHAMCLVSSPRVSGEYPDRGASAEVYTNPDPKKYVELETLGPLSLMKRGDKISRVNTYTLFPRTSSNPERDARRVFAP